MKLFLVILLGLSILCDFSLACSEGEFVAKTVKDSVCNDLDTHSTEESHSEANHSDCHCHQGHSHSFPLTINSSTLKTPVSLISSNFPEYLLKFPQEIHLILIKPPIFV